MEYLKSVLTFITGGLAGSVLTHFVNWRKDRVQIMECRYTDDEILSKLPTKHKNGVLYDNIYCKYFELENTTNKDIDEFKVVFQFDNASTIIEYIDITKSGAGKHKMKRTKQNECTVTVKKFIRTDKINFTFKIANVDIAEDKCYVTEDDCMQFKIQTRDCRKKTLNTKAKISSVVLTLSADLNKAEDE